MGVRGELALVVVLLAILKVDSLDNGLALTPPMGWMSWQRYRCTTNCVDYPDECLSDNLIRATADRMAEDGYLEAGYQYVIIDDCWLSDERDSEGRLQPDPDRFPNGIKDLADYVHSKGLLFGIYEDIGTKTCAGYPGIDGNYELDANTFAEWGADYLKMDGCYEDTDGMEDKYTEMSVALNQSGRPIVFSCSFTAYKGLDANYSAAQEGCNLWRNYGDIDDSWESVVNIANWFAENQGYINKYAGPGHWNDPDMLVIGNYGLSYDQSVAQMTMWSLMAAPLLMSVDLKSIKPEMKEILLNKDVIAINQDELGIPGLRSYSKDDIHIWVRQLLPVVNDRNTYAFGFVSFRSDGTIYHVKTTLADYGLDNPDGYEVKNIFQPGNETTISVSDTFDVGIVPSGAVLLLFTPISSEGKVSAK